jgi:hypothetical protein
MSARERTPPVGTPGLDTQLFNCEFVGVHDTILLGNLHHLILLVETALLTTKLEITRLVHI